MSEVENTEIIDVLELRSDGTCVVKFNTTEAALAELRARFKGATFDLTTTAGNEAARKARQELVSLRTALEKRRKEAKAPVLDFGKKLDAEAKRIEAEILKLESPIDAAIKADEKRREREREEKAQAERDRVARHEAALEGIENLATDLIGKPPTAVRDAIAQLNGVVVTEAQWEEFAPAAERAKAKALASLGALLEAATALEDARAAAKNTTQAAPTKDDAARDTQEGGRMGTEGANAHAPMQPQRDSSDERRKAANVAACAGEMLAALREIHATTTDPKARAIAARAISDATGEEL